MAENATGKIEKIEMELSNGGTLKIELYPEFAPKTTANFLKLAKEGFYDGLLFHRVIKGFMIQGGDPNGVGTGGPGYSIAGEFSSNGFAANTLKHTRGTLSMARSSHPDSAGSQFFIMHADAAHLDGQYAAFGRVTEGMEFVDKIAEAQTARNDKPIEPQSIKKIIVLE
jgi:peptidyl-prolyl cis-trans isomerase B (cyclophilin B)